MTLSKLITMGVFGFVGYQQQDLVMSKVGRLITIMPKMQTSTEMDSYKKSFHYHFKMQELEGVNIELPYDISDWLNRHFEDKSGKRPEKDYFGSLYRAEEDESFFKLRSCGGDTTCQNTDDIIVHIWKKR
jgi:hypothetical protein